MKRTVLIAMTALLFFLPAALFTQPAPAPAPNLHIAAKDLEDFYAKVAQLPEKPVGNGRCQLVRIEKAGRVLGICKGECPAHKACYTAFRVGPGDAIDVRCQCK